MHTVYVISSHGGQPHSIHFLLLAGLAKSLSSLPLHCPLFTHRPTHPVHCHSFMTLHLLTSIHQPDSSCINYPALSPASSHAIHPVSFTDTAASSNPRPRVYSEACLTLHIRLHSPTNQPPCVQHHTLTHRPTWPNTPLCIHSPSCLVTKQSLKGHPYRVCSPTGRYYATRVLFVTTSRTQKGFDQCSAFLCLDCAQKEVFP